MPENVVYILGAGFSAPLGVPVSSNFLEKAKDLFFRDPPTHRGLEDVFSKIEALSYVHNYYETNLFNIEEILSILEMRARLGDTPDMAQFERLLKEVIEAYTPELRPASIEHGSSNIWAPDLWYTYWAFVANLMTAHVAASLDQELAGLYWVYSSNCATSATTRYSVITFNYDCVLERVAAAFAQLPHRTGAGLWRFAKPDAESEPETGRPLLAKLHGSVDGAIIPPTWNKSLRDGIEPIWRAAFHALSTANHLRFIGYSMPSTDAYVRYLFKSAVIDCKHLKTIDVICRDPHGDVRQRYAEFCRHGLRFRDADTWDYLRKNSDLLKVNRKGTERSMRLSCDTLENAHQKFMDQAS